ncbi:MAG: tetratricopeptide repeat protein [Bacteroidetes bacterium]|jgi:tetratricopeptide (TPR) repeat protein|nr:tetratricopeptide repeat protein [Bacteroidota bacterium]MBT3748918.1 tetratricopeptide repeat protein [Bacteroidota bacterium]MBT4401424.1 tetratricopeptide repeat protein [Bacteroidota bacterium]MBT4410690.1 tetratricopeptide repeat protein [Bacteroidota bacterium]MBT5426362.1 tetratricopeptide repeat protein [Bacteroidota bacterium]
MNGKVMLRTLGLSFLLIGLSGAVQAQDINKAREAFNKALEMQTSDVETAITSVKECLDICGQIGEDADDIRMRAELKLPELYVNAGNQLVKAKKYPDAISAFEEALKVADEYNNELAGDKAKSMLPQLHYVIGGGLYKRNNFVDAMSSFQKAISINPDYAKAYYYMGLTYKKQKNLAEFESSMDKGLVAAKNSRDNNHLNKIKNAGTSTFLSAGAKAVTDGKPAEGIALLEKALKYNSKNADIYFYIGTANIEQKQWDKAIEASNNGLNYEKDDPEKKAKHYFNLGLAYKGKGDKNSACTAFNNALYGQFKANAQYEIDTELKCNE